MTRVFMWINTVLISMVLGAAHIFAQSLTPWSGGTQMPDFNGQTYTIHTAEELAWIAAASRTDDFSGKRVLLAADIDLGGSSATPPSWEPIGSATKPFQGELDGANHVIYNLYILSSLLPTGAGLLAECGNAAVVHHLGIAQGQIMTDAASNVGCLTGTNRGQIHHCFNMAHIIAHNGDNIGGLVGSNHGSISYSYNAGIITDGNNHVGGLVGYNHASAVLDNCYNMGYCKGSDHVGALFGKNEAPETNLTMVYFDQQLTRMYATGYGGSDPILTDNTRYAIAKSSDFIGEFSPYYENPENEWRCTAGGYESHPQLVCFANHIASELSVKSVYLDAETVPIMRAEGVGAPSEGNSPRNSIGLERLNSSAFGSGEWYSPSPDVIYISNPKGASALVKRPCGNQEVILTISCGPAVKQVYTIVKGYEAFDAGILNGYYSACWNEEEVKFKEKNNNGKEASGGKDDEQKDGQYSYQYRLIRDTVITAEDGTKTYLPMDTIRLCQEDYNAWAMPTDVPGDYAFRRDVHDVQCKTEWTRSQGRLYLKVRKEFDPGELKEQPDTLYGILPMTTTIQSIQDASGGGEVFHYKWMLKRSEWIVEERTWKPVPEETRNPLYIDGEQVETPSVTYSFDKPGTYTFTRSVREEACKASMTESRNPHVVVVFEAINPGSIESFNRNLCSEECMETIHEIDTVSGGNGIYSYRWLCNGEEIPQSDTTSLPLENILMEAGNTYVFTRQVKDDTGLMDWLNSRGSVSITIYGGYNAGSIEPFDLQVCSDAGVPDEVTALIREEEPAKGSAGSVFTYCWLLYRGSTDTKPFDTLHIDAPILNTAIPLGKYHLTAPVSIFLQRAVKNILCEGEWQVSEGKASWRFGRAEKKTERIVICAGDLPYEYTYTFADGHTKVFRFTRDKELFVAADETHEGCPMDVTLVSEVLPVPAVEVVPEISVCETENNMKIAYTVISGAPERFDLYFPQASKEAGFRDSIGAFLPEEDVIEVPLPKRVPLGPQEVTIRFYTDEDVPEKCKQAKPQKMTFTINLDGYVRRKGEDVVYVDNSGMHTEGELTFVAYQWYRDGVMLSGETDQFLHENPSLDGIYQVEMTTPDGTVYRSCLYAMYPTQGVEEVRSDGRCRKIIENGQLVLVVGDQRYTATGQKIQ